MHTTVSRAPSRPRPLGKPPILGARIAGHTQHAFVPIYGGLCCIGELGDNLWARNRGPSDGDVHRWRIYTNVLGRLFATAAVVDDFGNLVVAY